MIFAFFLILTVYALHRRLTTWTWVLLAITLLTKFQGIAMFPLVLILTWRRSPSTVLRSILLCAGILLIVLLPFMVVSGTPETLRPYIGSSNKYPFVTLKAYNFWYWALSSSRNMTADWFQMPPDIAANFGTAQGVYWGPITARAVGLFLFGLAALAIAIRAWHFPEQEDEFSLAAGLFTAFFMFSTQMHERYEYPALVLLTFAWAKDRRLWFIWLGMALIVTYNILAVASRDYPLWNTMWPILNSISSHAYQYARLNVLFPPFAMILSPFYKSLASRIFSVKKIASGLGLQSCCLLVWRSA